MLRATIKSLLARKLRLLLSAMAVVLGVSFVVGAFTFGSFGSGVSPTSVLMFSLFFEPPK